MVGCLVRGGVVEAREMHGVELIGEYGNIKKEKCTQCDV